MARRHKIRKLRAEVRRLRRRAEESEWDAYRARGEAAACLKGVNAVADSVKAVCPYSAALHPQVVDYPNHVPIQLPDRRDWQPIELRELEVEVREHLRTDAVHLRVRYGDSQIEEYLCSEAAMILGPSSLRVEIARRISEELVRFWAKKRR